MKVAIILVACMFLIADANANETVASPDYLRLEPVAFDVTNHELFDDAGALFVSDQYVGIERVDLALDNVPSLTVLELETFLQAGYGWWWIATHGLDATMVIETFPLTTAGHQLREDHHTSYDARYAQYGTDIVDRAVFSVIQPDGTLLPRYNCIFVRPEFIRQFYRDRNSVVHMAICTGTDCLDAFDATHSWPMTVRSW